LATLLAAPGNEYAVLMHLSEAPDRALRPRRPGDDRRRSHPTKRSASSAFPQGTPQSLVVAGTTTVSAPPPPCRTAAWSTGRSHRGIANQALRR